MKRHSIFFLIILAIVGIVLLVRNNDSKSFQKNEIIIGVITPLTKENATIGQGIKNAIELARKGSGFESIRVIYEDDQFDAKTGLAAFQKLREIDHVDAIINTTPSVIDSARPMIKDRPLIIAQIAEPEKSYDDTIFQFMPSGEKLYENFGEFVKKQYSFVVIAYQQSPTFEKAVKAFEKEYRSDTNQFGSYSIDDQKQYRTLITKMLTKNPQAITVLATPSVGTAFLKQFEELRSSEKIKFLCNPDLEATMSEYLKVFQAKIFEGCLSAFFADRMSEEFKSQYRRAYGQDPTFAADYAYDAFVVLNETYTRDVEGWKKRLQSFRKEGMSGFIQFDRLGVRVPEIEFHVFRGDKFVKYEQ